MWQGTLTAPADQGQGALPATHRAQERQGRGRERELLRHSLTRVTRVKQTRRRVQAVRPHQARQQSSWRLLPSSYAITFRDGARDGAAHGVGQALRQSRPRGLGGLLEVSPSTRRLKTADRLRVNSPPGTTDHSARTATRQVAVTEAIHHVSAHSDMPDNGHAGQQTGNPVPSKT